MNMHLSEFAPANLPRIEYATVDDDQAGHISEAMTLPENQAKFDIAFIPIDTPEARHAAAAEWADYKHALGNIAAKERGAYLTFSGNDESPEALERILEEHIYSPRNLAAHALLKATLKTDEAKVYDLLQTYYEPESDTLNQ